MCLRTSKVEGVGYPRCLGGRINDFSDAIAPPQISHCILIYVLSTCGLLEVNGIHAGVNSDVLEKRLDDLDVTYGAGK